MYHGYRRTEQSRYHEVQLYDSADSFTRQIPLNVLRASLIDPFRARLKHGIDILLFNPPYVETDIDELYSGQEDSDVKAAWAGGSQGMEVTNQVLDIVGVTARLLFGSFRLS